MPSRSSRRIQIVGAAALAFALGMPSVTLAETDLFCSANSPLFGSSKVVLSGGSRIHSNRPDSSVHVGSNSLVTLSGDSRIDGDAVSGGEVKLSGDSVVTGAVVEDAPQVVLDEVAALVAAYESRVANHPHLVTDQGEEALDGTELVVSGGDSLVLPAGDYYLTKLVLSGGSTLRLEGDVRVFMPHGKADLSGGSLANQPGHAASLLVVVAAKGEVKLSGGSNFHGAAYVPHGKVEVSGAGDFYGAATARELKLSGGSEIHAHDVCVYGLPQIESEPVVDEPEPVQPDPDEDLFGWDGI